MRPLVVLCIFLVIIAGHFVYITGSRFTSNGRGEWASFVLDQAKESRLSRYVTSGEYWMGLSYGLAGAFAAFCLIEAIRRRQKSLTASGRGVVLGGLLSVSICFFVGCCGSPMLPVYLGLLGPKFLGLARPMTFALTVISICIGYWWMFRRVASCECKECQH